MLEAKDGFFTMYYAFHKIVLDVLVEKFHITVEDDTVTQSALIHNNILGYDLPTLDFVSPPEEPKENQILHKDDSKIYTHLENVLVQIFKYSSLNVISMLEIKRNLQSI